MKRKRFSDEQIIEILRLHQAGRPVPPARDQRGGAVQLAKPVRRVQVSDAKRLRSLEEKGRGNKVAASSVIAEGGWLTPPK